jgi:predicted O-methyltransferase YrrM
MRILGSIAYRLLPAFVHSVIQAHYYSIQRRVVFCRQFGWRYWPLSHYLDVQGFLMPVEAKTLYDLARSAPAGAVVVEIGSWLGKSAVVFGAALRSNTGARIYCIDPFDGSDRDERASQRYASKMKNLEKGLYETFLENVARAGFARLVNPLPGMSGDVAEKWTGEIDLLFIDGDHSYEAVLSDFVGWSKFVKPGGYVCFHDVSYGPNSFGKWHEGPKLVVEGIVKRDADWEAVGLFHSLFVARRAGSSNRIGS